MSVEQQVDALADAVDALLGSVNSKTGTLDAAVADGVSATAQAQAAKVSALSARDQAGAFKDAAYAAAQSAASAVAYQDLTALAQTKAVNAVDVFIYDTSKDSDGGAWRHRCAGKSWFNEPLNTPTRGARREFPALAVIIVENVFVRIYDADHPALPMWGQISNAIPAYSATRNTSAKAKNGIICVSENAGYGGLAIIDLPAAKSTWHGYGQGGNPAGVYVQENWNTSTPRPRLSTATRISSEVLVNRHINDVAMTVLPDAPIAPATGLPVPTIAVATKGGVSLIKDDGTVTDIFHSDAADVSDIWLRDELLIYNASQFIHARKIPSANVAAGARFVAHPSDIWFAPRFRSTTYSGPSFQLHPTGAGVSDVLQIGQNVFLANSDRLNQAIVSDVYGQYNALANFTTSDYNTGWMPGDIKGAFLADTNDADLVGETAFADDFSAYANSDALNQVWSKLNSAVLSLVAGRMRVANGPNGRSGAYVSFPTVAGRRYSLVFDGIAGSNPNVFAYVGVNAGGASLAALVNAVGMGLTATFVATTSTTFLTLYPSNTGAGSFVEFDNVFVRATDTDRSVNANGLIVNGTITRFPVATGADLMAYSGFSVDNYFEVTDTSYGETLYALGWEQTNGVWGFNHGVASAAPIDGLTITEDTLKIAGTKPKALIRLTATVPTTDQLARIEADEKLLFQENAACTLYGTSNAVTAIAHDRDTGLLHVGTNQGRSVFKGLRRVAHTTEPVTAAIAANRGMVVQR